MKTFPNRPLTGNNLRHSLGKLGYFDRESNQWKDASGYAAADLPGLIYGLQKALAYITDVPLPELDMPESPDAPPPQAGEVPF